MGSVLFQALQESILLRKYMEVAGPKLKETSSMFSQGYLEGRGGLVSGLRMGRIIGVTKGVIGVINLLTKSP